MPRSIAPMPDQESSHVWTASRTGERDRSSRAAVRVTNIRRARCEVLLNTRSPDRHVPVRTEGSSGRGLWRSRGRSPALGEFRQLSIRLLQPEPNVHLAVHRRRGGEVFARLLALARARAQLPEAEVAVGDERAHATQLGEGQRLAVVGL